MTITPGDKEHYSWRRGTLLLETRSFTPGDKEHISLRDKGHHQENKAVTGGNKEHLWGNQDIKGKKETSLEEKRNIT